MIKVRKTDIPAILNKLGHNGYVTVEEWDSINHRLVSLNKKKA
jgi:hypothetical protein